MKKAFTATMGAVSALVLAGSYYASLRGTEASASTQATTRAPTAQAPTSGSTTSSSDTGSSGSGSTSSSSTTSSSTSSATTAASTFKDGTYTGTAEQNPYGAVQVQVTISGGRITAVQVPQYPTGGRSDEINRQAVPALVSETLSAQSANVDMVSGATFTSQGYTASLQAALDEAKA